MTMRHAGRRLGLTAVLIVGLAPAVLPAQAATGEATVKPTTRLYGIDVDVNGAGGGEFTTIAVYDAKSFRQVATLADGYTPPGSFDEFVDEQVQAGSNGRLAVTANGGGDSNCTFVKLLSSTGHLLGFLPDSLDQSGAGALSGDGRTYAFDSGPYAAPDPDEDEPSENSSCPSTVDHIDVVPTATLVAAPPAAQTQNLPAGIGFDRGWSDNGLAIAPDDHTLAVSVNRPHLKAALDILDSRSATLLSQGRIVAAPGCGLLAPAYLPDKTLAAIRVCGKKTDVVEVGHGSALTSLGTLPSSQLHALDAAPDGRLLVAGPGTTTNHGFTVINGSYDIAANGKGGLHRITFTNLPTCPGGGRPDRCSFDAESW